MKINKLVLLIVICFFMTGCVSYTELNELGIIDMILIDKKDDNYIVTINMLTPKKDDLEAKTTYSATDLTLDKCLGDLYLYSSKKISFSHLELMVFTPNIAKKEYDEIINLFLNRVDSRNTFNTVIIDNYEKLFNYKSRDINDLININNSESGIVETKQFDDVIKDILELEISYIPRLTIKDTLLIEGYQSIYDKNKLLTKEESIGYNFITNNIHQSTFTSNNIGFKLNSPNTSIKVDKNKIQINVNSTYQIVNNNTNINNDKDLEKECNKAIKKYISAFLKDNNLNYFYNIIKKYDYKYYLDTNNIKIEFDINTNLVKVDNSNIKGD